jgi:hypothetical protein
MMQNPNGTVTRLPYPGEPGYQGGAMPMGAMPMGAMAPPGLAGPMNPMQQGMGYDQYMGGMLSRMRQRPRAIRMPAPPPRFPTPGRMDGTRDYPGRQRGMMMPLGGM